MSHARRCALVAPNPHSPQRPYDETDLVRCLAVTVPAQGPLCARADSIPAYLALHAAVSGSLAQRHAFVELTGAASPPLTLAPQVMSTHPTAITPWPRPASQSGPFRGVKNSVLAEGVAVGDKVRRRFVSPVECAWHR